MPDKFLLIKNASIVNEGKQFIGDVLVKNERVEEISPAIDSYPEGTTVVNGKDKYLLPGVIDTHVHFREPGLVYKADLYTESRAAVAGGVTSYMDMPNTVPPVLTHELLEDKFNLAATKSFANYSFYMGTSNTNLVEALKTDPSTVCGVKIFFGTSTGNLKVDDEKIIEQLFAKCPVLLAAHCEDDHIIENNLKWVRQKYGDNPPPEIHPRIRDVECCYRSTLSAIKLAKKYNTRLHVVHVSTGKEASLFGYSVPLAEKRITSEVCIHHLWFSDKDYLQKGNRIKWNPSIKTSEDQKQLWDALLHDRIDTIATDHAPHTIKEKSEPYFGCPSGGPMIQHSLVAMLEFYHQKKIGLETLVQKMCHAPAICFRIDKRGFIKKGYWADLTLVDLNTQWVVEKANLLYKCGWSPLEGVTFHSSVTHTIVNGSIVFENGKINESVKGKRLKFAPQ